MLCARQCLDYGSDPLDPATDCAVLRPFTMRRCNTAGYHPTVFEQSGRIGGVWRQVVRSVSARPSPFVTRTHRAACLVGNEGTTSANACLASPMQAPPLCYAC